jgi:hypothetical protein
MMATALDVDERFDRAQTVIVTRSGCGPPRVYCIGFGAYRTQAIRYSSYLTVAPTVYSKVKESRVARKKKQGDPASPLYNKQDPPPEAGRSA